MEAKGWASPRQGRSNFHLRMTIKKLLESLMFFMSFYLSSVSHRFPLGTKVR
jgi:hypothetical protein